MKDLRSLAFVILGVVFLFSSILKSLDTTSFAVQVSYYGLIRTPWVVQLTAITLIGIEALVGLALVFELGVRRLALPAAILLLLAFTALLGWALAFRNIQDCGCFGKFLPITPKVAIGKNLLLLLLAVYAWLILHRRGAGGEGVIGEDNVGARPLSRPRCLQRWRLTIVILGAFVITGLAILDMPSSLPDSAQSANPSGGQFAHRRLTWKGRELSLDQGTFLVAVFSESCAHCTEHLAALDRLAADPIMPHVAGLILAEEDVIRDFQQTYQPQFPLLALDPLDYMRLIGDAPARFILIHEGRQVHYWDVLPPDAKDLKAWMDNLRKNTN